MALQRLVLFGSTGATGSHVLRIALDAGYIVRAYARSPHKIAEDLQGHANLEIAEGDFANGQAIRAAIEGANFVVSTAGNAPASKKGKVMLALTTEIVAGMREHGVKRLVYQAGAFSPVPGTENPFFVKVILRPVLGAMMGISGMLVDNDAVMAFLKNDCDDLDWTVTRPGQLKEGESSGALQSTEKLSGTCQFIDLAQFTVDTVTSDAHIKAFPYVAYS